MRIRRNGGFDVAVECPFGLIAAAVLIGNLAPPEVRQRPGHLAGGDPDGLQRERLGHSSVQVTIDRYGHLLPSLDVVVAA